MRKTLSKHAVVIPEPIHKDDSDDDYGVIDPTYTAEKKGKKSLSKFAANNNVETADGHVSDEDYGEIKPDEFNKVVKKSLSKHAPNTDIVVRPTMEEVQQMANSDDEYGDDIDNNFIPKKVVKKTLSRYAGQNGDIITTTKPELKSSADSDEEYGGENDGVRSWD